MTQVLYSKFTGSAKSEIGPKKCFQLDSEVSVMKEARATVRSTDVITYFL